jgi:hypothetical protein
MVNNMAALTAECGIGRGQVVQDRWAGQRNSQGPSGECQGRLPELFASTHQARDVLLPGDLPPSGSLDLM